LSSGDVAYGENEVAFARELIGLSLRILKIDPAFGR
jgi:hypothetical protein